MKAMCGISSQRSVSPPAALYQRPWKISISLLSSVSVTIAFLVFAVIMIRKMPALHRYLPLKICILVLIAGACGNLIDRILHKYVVDFIYFSLIDFPIFNAADIYVTLSVTALILLVIFKYKEEDFTFLKRRTEHE